VSGFIPPSGTHDATCSFVCKAPLPRGSCVHSCTVCDAKSLNEVLTELGYRTEPVYLRNGDLRHGRKHVFCGPHRIIAHAHASEVWAWLAVTYPDVHGRSHL
jgi:hypothetical protein